MKTKTTQLSDIAIETDTCPHCVVDYTIFNDQSRFMTKQELVKAIKQAPITCGWREGMACITHVL